MEITISKFQTICKASSEQFTEVLANQMSDITLTKICSEPQYYMSIGGLTKKFSRPQINRVLKMMIGEVNFNFNGNHKLSKVQIEILASHILTVFERMSLEAIFLCFRNIMSGAYGEIMKLDMAYFCDKLNKFDDDWYAEFCRIRDSKHLQDKGSMKNQFTDAAVTLYRKYERG